MRRDDGYTPPLQVVGFIATRKGDEDRGPGQAPVVVLDHDFWTRRFDQSPAIIGEPILLNGRPYTIVGASFHCPRR